MSAHPAALLRAWLLCLAWAHCLGAGGSGAAAARPAGPDAAWQPQAQPWEGRPGHMSWWDARAASSPAALHAAAKEAVPARLQLGQNTTGSGGGLWATRQLLRKLSGAAAWRERGYLAARRLLQAPPPALPPTARIAAAPAPGNSPSAYLLLVFEVRALTM